MKVSKKWDFRANLKPEGMNLRAFKQTVVLNLVDGEYPVIATSK